MCAFLPVCIADADVTLLAGVAILIVGLLVWETVWGPRERRKRRQREERERKRRNHWGHA
jgi:type II secretory pathway component PulM